jgi:YD repeat-containing protein
MMGVPAPAPAHAERARRTTRFERDKMGRLLAQATATSVTTFQWDDGRVKTSLEV